MMRCLLLALLLITPLAQAQLSQEELQTMLADRIEGLKFLTKNGMLLQAIREQNRAQRSLDDIKAIDADVFLFSECANTSASAVKGLLDNWLQTNTTIVIFVAILTPHALQCAPIQI